jgi:hypothetical protein
MPYITPYFTPKEMHDIEVYCEKNHMTKYALAQEAVLERIRKK